MTDPIVAHSRRANELVVDDLPLLTFAGCDYLGMARERRLLEVAREGLLRYGISPSASRWTTGTTLAHEELERAAARFCGAEDAVLLPIGFLADEALLQALEDSVELWLVDECSHSSLFHALAHVRTPHLAYRHRDPDHLADRIRRDAAGKRFGVATDGVFPNEGALAPLDAIAELAGKAGAVVAIDDAHGFGILGPNGRGTREHFGVEREGVYMSATLSKAFGTFGGILPLPAALARKVRQHVSFYAGATPIPAALAAAATAALEIVSTEGRHLEKLRSNIARLGAGLEGLGLPAPQAGVPIFAIPPDRGIDPVAAHAALRREGILVPHSQYPGTPPGGLLRGTLSATHTAQEIDRLLEALATRLT